MTAANEKSLTDKKPSCIIIFLCKNCVPAGGKLPVQWNEEGVHVRIREIPCSGKVDAQYMMHALEGDVGGIFVITCPVGECTLSQGNYRAEMRVKTVQRLLAEAGLDPKRAGIAHCKAGVTIEGLKGIIGDAVRTIAGTAVAAQS
ncbi:MAG TPA: hydrogenase iron-sulfur subunit [Chitinivibrionales bacterium]|nr:hydrogenase iron-sulfur subunit [Chitinivibrionales bacterium]